jgi:tRNA1Val (adenine37-N6)-methyltransferase
MPESDLLPGPDESLDLLAGGWKIFQLRRGHRFSTDDLVTAWRAALARPDATRVLDLGCGIGSVGLLTLFRLGNPAATLLGIEAQAESAGLAQRTVRLNGLADRVRIVNGDLRESGGIVGDEKFPLITGSPPYVPPGKGIISPVPQRAAARHELRGSVFDYCAAARRHLAPGGRFCFVMQGQDPRTEEAPVANGLVVVERWDVYFRDGRAPHICTMLCARAEDIEGVSRVEGRLVIRDGAGRWTDEYMDFRRTMGAPENLSARDGT